MKKSTETNLLTIVTAIVLALMSTPSQATTNKDINGFTPGMSFSEAEADCNSLSGRMMHQSYDQQNAMCIASETTYGFMFATNLPGPPRLMIVLRQMRFPNSAIGSLIDSISKQFNATPSKDPCDRTKSPSDKCKWELDDGLVLALTNEGLLLISPELLKAENEAIEMKKNSPPVPKF
jgi:hypothetical protein